VETNDRRLYQTSKDAAIVVSDAVGADRTASAILAHSMPRRSGRFGSSSARNGVTSHMGDGIETTYDGAVRISPVVVEGRSIWLARPADPDRLLGCKRVQSLNAHNDYMPYWAYLWPGAYLLAVAVAREPWLSGREALEIGCGLGLAGLVGVAAGLKVVFSDYDAAPLRFVAQSARENGFDPSAYSTRMVDWSDPPNERFEIILGADVLYERRLVPLVVNLIKRTLAPGGVALLAGPYRVATDDLEPQLWQNQLTWQAMAMTATNEAGQEERGTLYRIAHRL
jgi:predicted nicotinamide N-methyase